MDDPGRGCFVVVRGCLVGTVQDCYEWHTGGTAGEDVPGAGGAVGSNLDSWVRPILGDHCIVTGARSACGSSRVTRLQPLRLIL
jgi:hypothetical protein